MHAPCFFDSMKNLLIHQQINWNFNHDKSTQKSDIHVCVLVYIYINENYMHGYDKKRIKRILSLIPPSTVPNIIIILNKMDKLLYLLIEDYY